ncbi:MAG: HD domain-containing protein [Clostridia bacterium]|nr:HD domain-containing protein [Clostridia bacterium]
MRYTKEDDARFQKCLCELAAHPDVQILKHIPQHRGSTTFAHSVSVANCAYHLAKKSHLKVEIQSLVCGAMLHDFYLYDTETMPYSDYRHSLIHPKLALQNAEKRFKLNARERNIILSHMWPIPCSPLPRCKEAWLVSIADKMCAWKEMHK